MHQAAFIAISTIHSGRGIFKNRWKQNLLLILLLFFALSFSACNRKNKEPAEHGGVDNTGGLIQSGPGVTLKRHYSSYNDFISYVRGNPIKITPVNLSDSVVTRPGNDTTFHYFEFFGSRFKYASVFLRHDTEENEAGDSLYSWNFTVDDRKLMARSVPDAVRGNDFSSGKLTDLNLELDKAGKFVLNNATYLVIPSETSSCEGGFCRTELDHIFKLQDSLAVYFTVDGWNICNLKNDNQIEQIVFNDHPSLRQGYLDELKKRIKGGVSIDLEKCFRIEIWALKGINNEQWEPMTDKNGKSYFIFMSYEIASSPNTYKVLDYNWIKTL